VRILRARVVPFALPLRAPLATAHGILRERHGALLALETDLGLTGLGEATPIAGFGLETPARTREALARLGKGALGRDPRVLDALLDAAELAAPDAPCARAAFDSALHDLVSQSESLPLATWLARRLGTVARTRIEVSMLLTGTTTRDLVSAAERAVADGFRSLKLKIAGAGFGADRERVHAVRCAVGPAVRIRVDANGGFATPDLALRAIATLAPYGLEWIEQPVPASDLAALTRVRSGSPIPIAADEAAVGSADLVRVLADRAADWIVLKPSALGGLRAATRAAALARTAGCGVAVTTLLDGAVARAGALALAAALPGPLPACGLATGSLLAADLAESERFDGAALSPATIPGLGVPLDPGRLERVAEGRGRILAHLDGRAA
jgi:o-succinylbenzoate synthase